jgi:hypothetical protein
MVLKEWLPSVIQTIEPYVSSQDIDKGARWSTDIAKELEDSSFGIVCITQENVQDAWLNFEAGALSKSVEKSRVCPFLFGVKRASVKGPALQFQSTVFEEDDVKKLLHSINSAMDTPCLEEGRLDSIYEVWWPKLKEKLDLLTGERDQQTEKTEQEQLGDSTSTEVLEEILELTRSQQRLLNSPEVLLPREYVEHVFKEARPNLERGHPVYQDLSDSWRALLDRIQMFGFPRHSSPEFDMLFDHLQRLEKPIRFILRRQGVISPRFALRHLPLFDDSEAQQEDSGDTE